MQTLILAFILALFTAYFSSQNTVGVTIRWANQTLGIFPLYILIIFSILFGFLVSYIFSLSERIRREKQLKYDKKFIKEEEVRLEEYTDRIHQLEISNAQMKMELEAYGNLTTLQKESPKVTPLRSTNKEIQRK